MLPLVLVLATLALGGALVLYLRGERAGPAGVPLALLRGSAWLGVALLVADPGCHGPPAPPTVLLDGSASMTDASGDARWRAAVDTARAAAGGGAIVVFGTAPRPWSEGVRPDASSSLLQPALRDARSRGGPVTVVTDGEVDDAEALPPEFLGGARVVLLPRPGGPDAGIAAVRLPEVLRAGDTATAAVDVVARGAGPGDSALVELREEGRVVARSRVALGAGGARLALAFVPGAPAGPRAVRRYEARVAGAMPDVEPRDDAGATAAVVVRAARVALFSESPDWDFRSLARTLRTARATPVRVFVRVAEGPWRDAATLGIVSDAAARTAAAEAALVVAHGPEAAVAAVTALARGSVWRWPTGGGGAAAPGDWYVTTEPGASPLAGALAGVPAESLPPLLAVRAAPPDSDGWGAVPVRAGRRGPVRMAVIGGEREGRRTLTTLGSGFWRWASHGGVAAEAHRALVLVAADWLLEGRPPGDVDVTALRDSLAREGREFLPRRVTLSARPGAAVARERVRQPLRQRSEVFVGIMAILCVEWVVRRRRGMR